MDRRWGMRSTPGLRVPSSLARKNKRCICDQLREDVRPLRVEIFYAASIEFSIRGLRMGEDSFDNVHGHARRHLAASVCTRSHRSQLSSRAKGALNIANEPAPNTSEQARR